MANNLRKFTDYAAYSAATLVKPAVSLIADTNTVYFDPKDAPVPPTPTFSGLTAHYNITNISQPTELFKGGGGSGSGSGSGSGGVLPSAMIVDGTAVEVTNTYQFSTTGEHIVNYSFVDNQIPNNFVYYILPLVGVEIGDAITSIDNNAFSYCHGLTSVTIPDNVISIGNGVFMMCGGLISCTIGSGVTRIGSVTFDTCSSLTSITIPSGVTSIGTEAFRDCDGLTSATCLATTPPTLGTDVFSNTNDCPIYVPAASVSAYMNASSWDAYTHRIQAIP